MTFGFDIGNDSSMNEESGYGYRSGNSRGVLEGVVKWFSDQRGYGFVLSAGKEYFIHFKEIQCQGYKSVKEGDRVRFEPVRSPRGWSAKSIVKI